MAGSVLLPFALYYFAYYCSGLCTFRTLRTWPNLARCNGQRAINVDDSHRRSGANRGQITFSFGSKLI
jgi:hypothetical protein